MIPAIVLVSIGGGFGAAARFLVDGAVQKANGTGVPLGTAVVNATGSFLVGLVSSAVSAGLVGDEAASFATIGILGGCTTFSTACVEAVRLLRGGMRRAALLHLGGVLAMSTCCMLAGLAAGGALL